VHLLEDPGTGSDLLGVSLPVFPVFFGSWVLGPVEEGLSLPEIHSRLQQGFGALGSPLPVSVPFVRVDSHSGG